MGGRVTSAPTSTSRGPAGTVSVGVVRALLDRAVRHHYGPQERHAPTVLGVYGDPESLPAQTFEHDGVRVRVQPSRSALAVREAILEHEPDTWLVVVTDRPEEDLGAGLLSHFVGHGLRTPDPWQAVGQRFAATGIEAALHTGHAHPADLAHGIVLALADESSWPPAPAGVLTRDHALGTVAQACLRMRTRAPDALAVLQWSAESGAAQAIADLRATAGGELTDTTIDWLADRTEAAAPVVRSLIRRGEIADVLPLGLTLSVLLDPRPDGADAHAADMVLVRIGYRWQGNEPPQASMTALAAHATQITAEVLRDRRTRQLGRHSLARADAILNQAEGLSLAHRSSLLPSGLTRRLQLLADELRGHRHAEAGQGAVDQVAVEEAWAAVSRHQLAALAGDAEDARIAPFRGAVRLSRWLMAGTDSTGASAPSLADLARRHGTIDAWVDAAVNDAATGVDDPDLGGDLNAVLLAVQRRRDRHNEQFAHALATATRDDPGAETGHLPGDGDADVVWLLEHLLPRVVFPIAHATPTLFLVLDGMSGAVATEIVDDILGCRDGWYEARLPGAQARGAALAVLPSLTEVSRASLLSGRLTTGQQDAERKGYAALTDSHRLGASPLFHKKPLDTSRLGYALADDVAEAIGNTNLPLVTCVLNTIDDALDRSDPAGTSWTLDAVKHLRPLLDRALAVGRTVVITADHGHVVERRHGEQKAYPDTTSSRSRSAAPPPAEGELLVEGSRVLKHGGSAVLPWSERLRYGPLKAGYHGGASPAEVVVPVIALTPGDPDPETGLTVAGPQAPAWWDLPLTDTTTPGARPSAAATRHTPAPSEDLFGGTLPGTPKPAAPPRLGQAVVDSAAYGAQRRVAGRVTLTDEQVSRAVDALAGAPGNRLTLTPLATALSLPEVRARGAVAQLQKLLNVEGYGVVRSEGGTVILDVAVLREQFGVRA